MTLGGKKNDTAHDISSPAIYVSSKDVLNEISTLVSRNRKKNMIMSFLTQLLKRIRKDTMGPNHDQIDQKLMYEQLQKADLTRELILNLDTLFKTSGKYNSKKVLNSKYL